MLRKLATSLKTQLARWPNPAPGPNRLQAWLDQDGHPNHHTTYPQRLLEKFGDIVYLPTLDLDHLIMNPEAAAIILRDKTGRYVKTPNVYTSPYLAFGRSVLTAEGDDWHQSRQIMQTAYHKSALAQNFQEMNRILNKKFNRWDKLAQNQQRFAVTQEMGQLSLENVFYCMFESMPKQPKKLLQAAQYLTKYVSEKHYRYVPSLSKFRFYRKQAFVDNTIKAVLEESTPTQRNRVLSLLQDSEQANSDPALMQRNLKTMLLSGYETTACLLNWSLYFLSQIPELQNLLQAETENVKDLAGLQQCEWLNAVIYEVLRLYPPIWNTAREATCESELGDYTIPATSKLYISIYAIHRHPDYWPEPDIFRPERFLKENRKSINRFAFMPFGTGQHQCIASQFALIEAKLILTKLVQRYRFENATRGKVRTMPYITLQPNKTVYIKLTARHQKTAQSLPSQEKESSNPIHLDG